MTTQTKRYSIAELTNQDEDTIEGLMPENIEMTQAEWGTTAALWLHLLGLSSDVNDVVIERAKHEVLRDAALAVRLNFPALDFIEWFRRADWWMFEHDDDVTTDEWGWGVLDRSRVMAKSMGRLAREVPLRLN